MKAIRRFFTVVIAWILNILAPRIAVDWAEWRAFRESIWNVKRDNRLVRRALRRARRKHFDDRKTYYIIRDKFGGINELTREQLDFFTKRGLFVKMNYMQRLSASIDIVSNNTSIKQTFAKIKSENEKDRDNA